MSVITKGHLPEWLGFRDYRKIGSTRAAEIVTEEVIQVVTKEGPITLPSGWVGHIALDAEDYPYPIEANIFDETYEPTEKS